MTDVAREYTAPEMAAWLVENGYTRDKVVKILVLGNSGVGKSFLCNAIVGKELFEHKTQLGSVTAANTFAAIEVGGVVYVICNVPGLIEVDQQNIARNKEAVEAVFNFQKGCRTICLFVASGGNGGRLQPEDYQAIHAVKNFVPLIPSATAFVVNCVDVDELDDVDQYRTQTEAQVHSLVDKDVAVVLFRQISKEQNQALCFDTPEMTELRMRLIFTLGTLKPVTMEPVVGARLNLENERLTNEIAELKTRIGSFEKELKSKIEKNDEAWRAEVEKSKAENDARIDEMNRVIVELKAREESPPEKFSDKLLSFGEAALRFLEPVAWFLFSVLLGSKKHTRKLH